MKLSPPRSIAEEISEGKEHEERRELEEREETKGKERKRERRKKERDKVAVTLTRKENVRKTRNCEEGTWGVGVEPQGLAISQRLRSENRSKP